MGIEAEDKVFEFLELFVSHPAVVSGFLVQFSATAWMSSVADSGGSHADSKGLSKENTSVMEVIVHVQYRCIVIA
jgi:hypothetical protein